MEMFDSKEGSIWNGWDSLTNSLTTQPTANIASPQTDLFGNKFLSPDTSITGNRFLSPDTDLNNVKLLSPDINTDVEQAGLFNLKGTLDFSTTKSAMVYSPVIISSSPFASVSSTPQTGDSTPSLGGNLGVILGLGVVAVGAYVFLK